MQRQNRHPPWRPPDSALKTLAPGDLLDQPFWEVGGGTRRGRANSDALQSLRTVGDRW